MSSNCFYTHEMLYRGYAATFKLKWPTIGSPWKAEQHIVVQGEKFGYILIQPVKEGVTLATLLAVFKERVMAMVDERCSLLGA